MTSKTSKIDGSKIEYAWSADNKLKQARVYKAGNVLNKTINHSYDGLGRRIQREVIDSLDNAKSYTRKFVYDGEHIIAVLDQNDDFIAGYVHGSGVDDPKIIVTDYNSDGELDALTLVKDHQNSVRAILNADHEVLQTISYSAYGESFVTNNGTKNLKLNNLFYYTGREIEPETGDYYYRARFYDPKVGRFLSEDPIGFLSSDPNFYRYTANNPVLYFDPSGLTQDDINLAFQLALEKYPGAVGVEYQIAQNGELLPNESGRYDRKKNKIYLNKDYLEKLCDEEAKELLDTVFHEIIHSQTPGRTFLSAVTPGNGRNNYFHNLTYKDAARDSIAVLRAYLLQRGK